MKKAIISILCLSMLITGCTKISQNYDNADELKNTSNQAQIKQENQKPDTASGTDETKNVTMANPASVNCHNNGGNLQIKKNSNGGEYGVCFFDDNRQCEEWAMMRGECPVGGIKVAGYENDAQVYCAITGGEVDMEKNICAFKDGRVLDINKYWDGDTNASSSEEIIQD